MAIPEKIDLMFKFALLGDSATGKTSLINRYVDQKFNENYQPSLGVNIVIKDLEVKEKNLNVRLILWDIAGQDRYELSRRMFFEGCSGAFFVYDITRPSTLENVESKWYPDLINYGTKASCFLLIGNKSDLNDLRKTSTEEGRNIAEKINAINFIETSAKSGENVEKAFSNLLTNIITKRES
ncbi:MAG: GTP-binding protein [Promethearchaeota archaeon]|nr:MAG: GTP-binding protein [Candidatus Lokiarchaeota archaeon]